MKHARHLPLLAFTICLSALQPFSPSALSSEPFRDPALPVAQRVDDLLSRLTTGEKISQLMMATPAIPRLGIPAYDWWNEALHGVARNGVATVFPQAIALAATWNPELHHRVADAISTEARAKNNELLAHSKTGATKRFQGLTIWSPNINIFRDPRWGRGQETYGEDPFLTSQFAIAFVRGLQGDDPRYLKTVATVKHFAVHSGPEPLRHKFNATVSERDLRETYLPAFEAGIREGGAQSLMSAYNAIDGIPAPANKLLLTTILRDEWGFNGAIVGDVDTVADLWRPNGHGYAKDAAEASADALKAGNDLCSGTTYEALPDALKRGLITEQDIDTALRRLLTLRFKLGQFDTSTGDFPAGSAEFPLGGRREVPPNPPSGNSALPENPYLSIPITENASPAHDALALEAARQSLVLLKNDGTLPLDARKLKNKTVAILGPAGFETSAIVGNYFGTPAKYVTLADGIRAKLESRGIRVLAEPAVPLVKGFRVTGDPIPDGILFTDATRATPGLKAEIFSNKKQDAKKPIVAGTPVATRIQKQIDVQWDETQPAGDIPAKNASLRWTGVMIPKITGDYTLGITTVGAARLYIDDKLVLDYWRWRDDDTVRPISAIRPLTAGQTYNIRLEFAQLTDHARVQFGWIAPGDNNARDRALAAARAADHIILTLGITSDLEGESMTVTAEGFSGGDRETIQLPETQRALLAEIAALHKPVILVLTGGSALAFDDTKANAVLLAWYYGQRGADAVADALLGDYNPAGRLPVTFYKSDADLPPFEDYSMSNRTYRYFKGTPLYAFGHGLSYTTFAYTDFKLTPATVGASLATPASAGNAEFPLGENAKKNLGAPRNPNAPITATITIKNTGPRDGDEVVQLYATADHPPVPMPLRQLVGFQRVSLKSGETKTLSIPVPVQRLRRWDDKTHRYVIDPGTYTLAAGPASDQPILKQTLTLLSALQPFSPSAFSATASRPFRLIKPGEQPFYNEDHSPIGGWAGFVYGMKESGGVQSFAHGVPDNGVIVAAKRANTVRVMPFARNQDAIQASQWVGEDEVKRTLGIGMDHWEMPLGVSWTHYSPVQQMPDWRAASQDERRRFALPVTYMQFVLDNKDAQNELRLLFSLQQKSEPVKDLPGWKGYRVNKDTLLLARDGDAAPVSASTARRDYGVAQANSAFELRAPANSKRIVTLFIVHNQGAAPVDFHGQKLTLMSDALFRDTADVVATAAADFEKIVADAKHFDAILSAKGLGAERRFLCAHALHSYQFNTLLYALPDREPVWVVIEGQYDYINTFDLTVDHLFYELEMHPWTVRNALDVFTRYYSYDDEISPAKDGPAAPGGISFYHDMGKGARFSTASEGADYKRPMTQEELQNWLLCAALYWKRTGDNAWLEANRATFEQVFLSMQLRDDIDPAKRDGVTTYFSRVGDRGGEITTYDAMDKSLKEPQNNLYITVKSFGVYSVLQDVFQALGDTRRRDQARAATAYTAKTVLSHWNPKLRRFPSTFDGGEEAPIIPAIEGLVYPYAMGRKDDVLPAGPYGELITRLRQHLETVLVPGVCIDSETGGWNLSPKSKTTWVSKVFLNQYVAEEILGLRNEAADAKADAAHYAYEVMGSPASCFTDQINLATHTTYAGRHYPRGVTTALWWLWSPLEEHSNAVK